MLDLSLPPTVSIHILCVATPEHAQALQKTLASVFATITKPAPEVITTSVQPVAEIDDLHDYFANLSDVPLTSRYAHLRPEPPPEGDPDWLWFGERGYQFCRTNHTGELHYTENTYSDKLQSRFVESHLFSVPKEVERAICKSVKNGVCNLTELQSKLEDLPPNTGHVNKDHFQALCRLLYHFGKLSNYCGTVSVSLDSKLVSDEIWATLPVKVGKVSSFYRTRNDLENAYLGKPVANSRRKQS